MSFDKKKALVTGASKRIGLQIAKHLQQLGYLVIIHSSNHIDSNSTEFQYIECDFRDQNQLMSILEELQDVQLLVNNASVFQKDELANISFENLQNAFSVNAFAALILTAKLPNLRNVINLLDAAAGSNNDYFLSYKLAKRSLEDITKIAAQSLAKSGARVNAIAIGYLAAPDQVEQKVYKNLINKTPLKLETTVSEMLICIDTILNCKSMTGNIIYLDSGVSL